MILRLPACWHRRLSAEFEAPYFRKLIEWLDAERAQYTIYPPENDVFAALRLTPFNAVRVVILGQDPYHDVNQAHGLAFSVQPGVRLPPSLLNIFKELNSDVGCRVPNNGCLIPWARQRVLLRIPCYCMPRGEFAQNQGWNSSLTR